MNSTRFPEKAIKVLYKDTKDNDVTILETMARLGLQAVNIIDNIPDVSAEFKYLIPRNDPIKDHILKLKDRNEHIGIFEGPDEDVLSRFLQASNFTGADIICRITADCPRLPQEYISQFVIRCLQGNDFASSGGPCRTTPDGFDVEVFTKEVLWWLDENTRMPDREHVTPLLYTDKHEFRGYIQTMWPDRSHEKYSIDTPEDLKRVQDADRTFEDALSRLNEQFGSRMPNKEQAPKKP